MKKLFAALTAFICASAVFTGCGKTDDDNKKSSGKSAEDELEAVVQELIDAYKDMDIKKIAELGLPDDLSNALIDMTADEIDELKDMAADELDEDMDFGELVSVKKTEDIDSSYLNLFEKGCSALMIINDYMKENDIDAEDLASMDESYLYNIIGDESLNGTPMGDLISILDSVENYDSVEDFAASDEFDKIGSRYTFTDGCIAEVTVKTSDGETETIKAPFYKIKGEGWNGDMILYPSMLEYVEKSRQTAMNSSASSLTKAANSGLADMDEDGADLNGIFIISSDKNKDYNVPSDIDHDEFLEMAEEYFYSVDDLDFFLVVSDGVCVYAVCENSKTPGYTGIYPVKMYPYDYDGDTLKTKPMTTDDEKSTLQELYDMTVEAIGKN